jgi:hypothetical protein
MDVNCPEITDKEDSENNMANWQKRISQLTKTYISIKVPINELFGGFLFEFCSPIYKQVNITIWLTLTKIY